MKHVIRQGATVDIPTTQEIVDAVGGVKGHPAQESAEPTRTTIRAMENLQLDATGSGIVDLLTIPPGFEFELRRMSYNLSTCSDSFTGAVQLGVAGVYIKLLRSGNFIEYAMPTAPTTHVQVPGVETWSAVEGPFLANGEKLQVQAVGLTANADLFIECTGLMLRPQDRRPR